MTSPRLSLLSAGRFIVAETGDRLTPPHWLRAVAAIPGAEARVWDSVIVETRLGPVETRADIMSSRAGPPVRPLGWGLPLLAAWHRRGVLHDVPLLWFEWDLPRPSGSEPLSSVCVSDSILGVAGRPLADGRVQRAVQALVGAGEAPAWVRAVDFLVASLGCRGEILHIATLRPRGLGRLRLDLHLAAAAVGPFLARLGWPGDVRAVARALFEVASPWERVGIQVELCPEVGEYLAIETRQYFRGADGYRFHAYLAMIAELAPVAADRAAAVEQWLAGPKPPGRAGHAYVKLVYADKRWDAKAYLGVTRHPRWA